MPIWQFAERLSLVFCGVILACDSLRKCDLYNDLGLMFPQIP